MSLLQRFSRHPAAPSVPRVPGLPLIGNYLDFRSNRLGLHEKCAALGPIARFGMGPLNMHVITDADIAHQVLTTDADAFIKARAISEFMRPLLGEGLLSSEGALHKRHRKLLAPAFAPKRMAGYAQVMTSETLVTARSWQQPHQVDIAEEMMAMTLAIAGKTLFGQDLRHQAAAVGEALTAAMQSMVQNMTAPVRIPYNLPLPRHRGMRDAVTMLNQVVYQVIAERRGFSDAQLQERNDVLSVLLLARDEEGDGTGFTDEQVRDEVMTLLLAGHETTANALAWTFYELGRNPAVLAELLAQIDAAPGASEPTIETLASIPLALAVIEESMRLHPPAYITAREAVRDITIGGHHFPKGATVAVNIRGIHRHSAYWERPLQFDPSRMLEAEKKKRSRHVYLPFGGGPRVCIGSHFALIEAQLCLVGLLANASVETLAKHREPEALVTLRPKDGLPAMVAARTLASDSSRSKLRN